MREYLPRFRPGQAKEAKDESVKLNPKGPCFGAAKAVRVWNRLRQREVNEVERHDVEMAEIATDRNCFRERCPHPEKYQSTERTPAHVQVTCCLCGRVREFHRTGPDPR
jgi:hypothetical protein